MNYTIEPITWEAMGPMEWHMSCTICNSKPHTELVDLATHLVKTPTRDIAVCSRCAAYAEWHPTFIEDFLERMRGAA